MSFIFGTNNEKRKEVMDLTKDVWAKNFKEKYPIFDIIIITEFKLAIKLCNDRERKVFVEF